MTDDNWVARYFSLTVGQIDALEAPERIRKGMGQYPLPVVILARLAVSVQDQGQGIGFGLLQDAIRRTMLIAEQAGIRAMLTHPNPLGGKTGLPSSVDMCKRAIVMYDLINEPVY